MSVPMVLRAPYGAGVGAPESHTDAVEMLFVRTPGLKVVVPSSPRKGRALLKAAIRDPDPVVFLEPIPIYRTVRESVPVEEEILPLERAYLMREGSHATLVAWGAMVRPALTAAARLGRSGVSVEVIDLMTLSPLDTETIAASVRKTGALVVVHEGPRTGDLAAEILARLFGLPPFRFARLCGWDIPPPMRARERSMLPTASRIEDALRSLLR
jgi:pyruvate dehydrogenase E1 component beta subunit